MFENVKASRGGEVASRKTIRVQRLDEIQNLGFPQPFG
jgi:hypothetical protein